MFPPECVAAAEWLLAACRQRGLMLVTAESCTGGLIAGCLTEIAGSSAVVDRGLVTYSNKAKEELLGVRADSLRSHGAVSERVAREMAEGALQRSSAGLSLAVTGIAGPDGGTPEKPVGLVHLAAASTGRTLHQRAQFHGDRQAIRLATVRAALDLGAKLLAGSSDLA
ncbi:MAG: CinA family protein [Geminicoccaceae bacterium]